MRTILVVLLAQVMDPPSESLPPSTFPVAYIVVAFLAFVIGREIICWYFKLNQITSLLRQMRDRLNSIQAYGTGPETVSKPPPAPTQDRGVSMSERLLGIFDRVPGKE